MPEMLLVQNVNRPGHTERARVDKYQAMRAALLAALLAALPGQPPGLTQAEMAAAIQPLLPQALWPGGAKSLWWMKTVQHDLEAKGLLRRQAKRKPLRWYRPV